MKTLFVIAGGLFLIIGFFNVLKYLSDYDVLAPYGKGFVLGNVLLLVAGFLSAFWGLKKKS